MSARPVAPRSAKTSVMFNLTGASAMLGALRIAWVVKMKLEHVLGKCIEARILTMMLYGGEKEVTPTGLLRQIRSVSYTHIYTTLRRLEKYGLVTCKMQSGVTRCRINEDNQVVKALKRFIEEAGLEVDKPKRQISDYERLAVELTDIIISNWDKYLINIKNDGEGIKITSREIYELVCEDEKYYYHYRDVCNGGQSYAAFMGRLLRAITEEFRGRGYEVMKKRGKERVILIIQKHLNTFTHTPR